MRLLLASPPLLFSGITFLGAKLPFEDKLLKLPMFSPEGGW
jgi:hypothetical protein